jgi:vacuolar protein sorting-associated protein 13B
VEPLEPVGEEDVAYDQVLGIALAAALDDERPTLCLNSLPIPPQVLRLLNDLSSPILMDYVNLSPLRLNLSLRLSKPLYLAIDHSPLTIHEFRSNYVATTALAMGQALTAHFLSGALYKAGNPVQLIGSLELLGSPGGLVRGFGSGLRDLVVGPVQGVSEGGPAGFVTGLYRGCSSLVRNVGTGTG